MCNPIDPWKYGPLSKTLALSYREWKMVVKNPLDPSWRSTSPFGFDHCLIHLTNSFSFGHVPMNLAIIARSFMYWIFSSMLPGWISYLGISTDLGRQLLEVFLWSLPGSFCLVLLVFLPLSGRFFPASLFGGTWFDGGYTIFCWYDKIRMQDEEGQLYCTVMSLYEGGSPPFREEAMGAKSLCYYCDRIGVHRSAKVSLSNLCFFTS